MDLNLSCELKRNQEKLVFLQQKEQKREGKKGVSELRSRALGRTVAEAHSAQKAGH